MICATAAQFADSPQPQPRQEQMASDLPPPRLSGWEQWFPPVVFLAVVVGVFTAVVVELRLPLPKGRSVRVDFSAIPLVRPSQPLNSLSENQLPPPHPTPAPTTHSTIFHCACLYIPLCMPFSVHHGGSESWVAPGTFRWPAGPHDFMPPVTQTLPHPLAHRIHCPVSRTPHKDV